MSKIQHYFETMPEEKQVHETSDGFLFPRKDNAQAHANTLSANHRKITTHYRPGTSEFKKAQADAKVMAEAKAKADKEEKEKAEFEAMQKAEAEEKAKKEAEDKKKQEELAKDSGQQTK